MSMAQQRRAVVTLAAVVLGAAALLPRAALADWGAPSVVSASATQQADAGDDPAISQDGRFVAFHGTVAGVQGVWRKQLANGDLQLVAVQGTSPSISADGRYVSFTTSVALDAVDDTNALGDVYVRDMTLATADAQAYTLASALDGQSTGIGYRGGTGSSSATRAALSADGRTVAFTVNSASDLLGGADPTPGGQVVLRHLDARQTILVSTVYDPATGAQTAAPVPAGATTTVPSLSADGTTVAWYATNVPAQTRTLPGEPATINNPYNEPLWRRVADGPAAPIRRIVGGADPFNPACPAGGRSTIGSDPGGANPCDGPFDVESGTGNTGNALANAVPQLSADGLTVALLVAAPPIAAQVSSDGVTANAYVVDMHPGLSRSAALRPLTAWASTDFTNVLLAGDLRTVAISPDGTHVAFTTPRGAFPLAPPLLRDPPLSQPNTSELYDVDLTTGTSRRVTHGYDGGPSVAATPGAYYLGAATPSYAGDDQTLAFASEAPNLFFGDGNGASDVFAARWQAPAASPGPPVQQIGPPPPLHVDAPEWRLGVTTSSCATGTVTLDAVVPGDGALTTSGRATVAVTRIERRHVEVKVHGHKRTKVVRKRVVHHLKRTVSSRKATVRGPGLHELTLTLTKHYRPLAKTSKGLAVTLAVTFRGTRSPQLRQQLPARFRVRAVHAKKGPACTLTARQAA
jgi:hypothetical protein